MGFKCQNCKITSIFASPGCSSALFLWLLWWGLWGAARKTRLMPRAGVKCLIVSVRSCCPVCSYSYVTLVWWSDVRHPGIECPPALSNEKIQRSSRRSAEFLRSFGVFQHISHTVILISCSLTIEDSSGCSLLSHVSHNFDIAVPFIIAACRYAVDI